MPKPYFIGWYYALKAKKKYPLKIWKQLIRKKYFWLTKEERLEANEKCLKELRKINMFDNNKEAYHPLKVKYKNWQGKTSIRTIIPIKVWYGSTEYHIEDQWLLDVWDMDKNAERTYAMMDIMDFIKKDDV